MPTTLTMPVTLTPAGGLATLEQGSRAELGQSVSVLLTTTPGERRCEPAYGTPAMLLTRYTPTIALSAIRTHEPRAERARVTVTGDGTGDTRVSVDLSAVEVS